MFVCLASQTNMLLRCCNYTYVWFDNENVVLSVFSLFTKYEPFPEPDTPLAAATLLAAVPPLEAVTPFAVTTNYPPFPRA